MASSGVIGNSSAELLKPKFDFVCRQLHRPHSVGVFYGASPLNYSFSILCFEFIMVIFFTRFTRLLLKPLRQPKIVSEIIGGVIIGPSVLGHNKNFTNVVFPDNAQLVIRNIGTLGFVYFLFVSCVQIDLSLIKKTVREDVYIAIIGVFVPIIASCTVGFAHRSSMEKGLAAAGGLGAVASCLAITSYPVIYLILKELNLLSSEIGRKAVTISLIGDALSIVAVIIFEAVKQAEGSYRAAILYMISLIIVGAFLLICMRRVMFWIIDNTPEGKPVEQSYVVLILLGALVMGFITDMFGVAIGNGALWLGLIIPSGPPLGATIVERSRNIVMDIFMPLAYTHVGLYVDAYAMAAYGWPNLFPLFAMVVTGYVSKLLSTLLVACYFGVPWKDSLTLSLMMNLRGQTELLVFLHWMDKTIIGIPLYSMLVFITALASGVFTFFITILYDPTRPYMVTRRRTVQHTPPGAELLLVVCITSEESVPGLINLIEYSNPSLRTPLMIYAIHLIELIGRAIPLFIDHEEQLEGPSMLRAEHTEKIYNALKFYDSKNNHVKLHLFTVVTPKRTMYQDICNLALVKKAALIIISFDKNGTDYRYGSELFRDGQGMQSMNKKIITHASCSVAILVEQGNASKPIMRQSFNRSYQKIILLFLGGGDAREALAYADRMVANPKVILNVIKFTASQIEGDNIEKKLDDGMLRWFWERNEANERVFYSEVLSHNGEETLAAIRALGEDKTDLWIVGRKQGINPMLLEGLLTWGENEELGVIGDFLASDDFGTKASVLVMHQQTMRGHGPSSDFS